MSAFTTTSTVDDAVLHRLRERLTGTLARGGEPGYELAQPFNLSATVSPRAVIAAASAEDVVETVRCACDHGLRVAVQRTGHGGVSVGGEDLLLVHTGRLDAVTVDPTRRTARVQAGAVWQQVLDAAAPHGLTGLVGSAPGVGVVGMVTGGGIGPLSRTYGMTSDSVRAFDLVTGDGRRLRVTAEENGELFWGLRGGKGTLGIVLELELELIELPELQGGAVFFDGADAGAVLQAWRAWTDTLPEHLNTSLAFLRLPPLPHVPEPLAGRATVAVRVTSPADAATVAALLAPIRAAGTPVLDTVRPMSPAELGTVHADPENPMPVYEETALLRELPQAGLDALLGVAGPHAESPQVIVELRLLGGALARTAGAASAFCHRDASFNLVTIGALVPPVAEAVPAHAAAVLDALAPFATGGAMPNFARADDPARLNRCYDEPTRAWLAALAERHDPSGVLATGLSARIG